ncbi:hypothetical protein AUR04nite_05680 [Glutamicibacter uratoxydans]|uniref:Uncharacterized protein n=1 Tax=Glutamicibacter uratoxydans TaxID=43667 RepID=A0A4Y4DJ91_GLUUR|nr:hypothetical protein [Glutamicibacter uratoxydans]GED05036.1 hypothetical protein AUR04nite_05680 [Glutamicibacter uratoxydans]
MGDRKKHDETARTTEPDQSEAAHEQAEGEDVARQGEYDRHGGHVPDEDEERFDAG